jgi:WD40 repeat protein
MKRKLLTIFVMYVLFAVGQLAVLPEANAHQEVSGNGTWSSTGSMSIPRSGHTATLLRNGKVLVAGGYGFSNVPVSTELYDPRTGTWSLTGSLSTFPVHTATPLRNGNVLVTTGDDEHITAELYNPRTGTWSLTGSPSIPRIRTATLLSNGNILVTSSGASKETELYDPRTGTWSLTGSLTVGHVGETTTLLRNGKVLITGDYEYSAITAELYDPKTGTWSLAGRLSTARMGNTATLLPDGKVLVTGGGTAEFHTTLISSAELYDPRTGTWSPTASMFIPRNEHTATLLPNGKVLVAGGLTSRQDRILPRLATNEAELYSAIR